jgi:hypothetical protein
MKILYVTLSVLALSLAAGTAHADNNNWKKNHPRRAEVLKRDRNLHRRTENAEKSGKITEGQAEKLEKEENAIRAQEKADAAANGGHITKAEQRDLNREENKVDRELRRDERRDRRKQQAGPTGGQVPPPPAANGAPATPPASN